MGLTRFGKPFRSGTAVRLEGRKYFRSFSPFSSDVRQPLLKSEYLRIIADRFSITEEVAEAQLLHEKRGRPDSGRRRFRSVNSRKPPEIKSLEEGIVRIMIKYPALVECVRESDALCCFEESSCPHMAGLLCRAGFCSRQEHGPSALYDLLRESDLQELYTRYLMEPYELEEPEIQLRDWLGALLKRIEKRRKKELQQSLQEAESKGDRAQVTNILVEIRNLSCQNQRW